MIWEFLVSNVGLNLSWAWSWAAAIDTKLVRPHLQTGYTVIWTFLYISVSFSGDFYTFGVLIWRLSWAPGEYSTPFSAIHVWSRLFDDRVYCGYLLNLNQSRPILDLNQSNQLFGFLFELWNTMYYWCWGYIDGAYGNFVLKYTPIFYVFYELVFEIHGILDVI